MRKSLNIQKQNDLRLSTPKIIERGSKSPIHLDKAVDMMRQSTFLRKSLKSCSNNKRNINISTL